MAQEFTPYDQQAWEALERWQEGRLAGSSRGLLPAPLRDRLEKGAAAVQDRIAGAPGADQFEALFRKALGGIQDTINRIAVASIRRRAVINAYRRRGYDVAELSDIGALALEDIDRVKPRLDLRYSVTLATEGATAGFVVSGGEIVAAGGSVAGAGAGAAPGAGMVVAAMATDAAAVIAASARVVAETAAYYGFDPESPEERLFALGVLSFGTATQAGKLAAYRELNKIVQALARRAAWEQLNRSAVTRIVRMVYTSLSMRITRQKLGQAVPVVGILLGAGLNAELLARVASDADHLYRQRFLREKYGIPLPTEDLEVDVDDDSNIQIAEIIDAELDESPDEAADDGKESPTGGAEDDNYEGEESRSE